MGFCIFLWSVAVGQNKLQGGSDLMIAVCETVSSADVCLSLAAHLEEDISINSNQIHLLQTSQRQQPDSRPTAQDFYPDQDGMDDCSPL